MASVFRIRLGIRLRNPARTRARRERVVRESACVSPRRAIPRMSSRCSRNLPGIAWTGSRRLRTSPDVEKARARVSVGNGFFLSSPFFLFLSSFLGFPKTRRSTPRASGAPRLPRRGRRAARNPPRQTRVLVHRPRVEPGDDRVRLGGRARLRGRALLVKRFRRDVDAAHGDGASDLEALDGLERQTRA